MGTTVLTSDRRDPTNPFAPTEYPGWMDDTPDNRRAALVEKVARKLAADTCGKESEWPLYMRRAIAAIDLIRAEVLEEAIQALARCSDIDAVSFRYAAAAIRALKDS